MHTVTASIFNYMNYHINRTILNIYSLYQNIHIDIYFFYNSTKKRSKILRPKYSKDKSLTQ